MDLSSRNKIKIEAGTAYMAGLIFLLLIFFIVILGLMTNAYLPVDLPQPSTALPTELDPVETTVVITEDNKYYVLPGETEAQARDFEGIQEKVSSEVKNSGKMKLKIAGHKGCAYEAVFNVLTFAQSNGWQPVLAYQNSVSK